MIFRLVGKNQVIRVREWCLAIRVFPESEMNNYENDCAEVTNNQLKLVNAN